MRENARECDNVLRNLHFKFRKGEIRAGDRTYDGVWEVTHGVQVKASAANEHAISVLRTAIVLVR
jgi:hypothetical protein